MSAAVAALAFACSPAARAACDDLLPPADLKLDRRGVTPMDIARLRDTGDPLVIGEPTSPYALSPDGKTLAFVIARADPVTNDRCSALVVLPAVGGKSPRILDRGGGLPLLSSPVRGLFMTTGFPQQIAPLWSPGGQFLAYRKVVEGVVQLVLVNAANGAARLVTRSPVDVEDFRWSADGASLIYLARVGRIAAKERIERAGRSGWVYDESVLPLESWEPRPWARDLPQQGFVVDPDSGLTREASSAEKESVTVPALGGTIFNTGDSTPEGARAWTEAASSAPMADRQLWASLPDGRKIQCRLPACTGRISRISWDRTGVSLVFQQREGWNGEETVLYRWFPAAGQLQTILRTSDELTGCIRSGKEMICGRENASVPRRIVSIDLADGRSRELFDPNPEFAHLELGKVRRLRWKNDLGLPAWGDLVLPPGYDGKARLPLVVVQYLSRGFLRGGIGDDYPIFALAAKGFAVLSFQRPPFVGKLIPGLKTIEEALAASDKDWMERRSLYSAVSEGIDTAIATGAVDPSRLGITGLSDGASTVEFALSNSDRFAAAAMSTCCDDLLSSLVLGGFAWGDANRKSGYPLSVDDDRAFWKPLSLSVNARRIDTPILMQLADREALTALPAIGAFREAGKPVEAIIYPDEYHNKWQPQHRLAVYQRNIDWFDFWLRDQEDPSPEKRDQYERWRRLRAASKGRR
ncbi:dipeptidyl aminopeptidase/acylaminoacyl peptidase [Novosphingobium sp. PhB55]|nr:dipeptidyl aminopeptidase/acylaminoacyl peptidase [Novosphingobium sp. PhB55]